MCTCMAYGELKIKCYPFRKLYEYNPYKHLYKYTLTQTLAAFIIALLKAEFFSSSLEKFRYLGIQMLLFFFNRSSSIESWEVRKPGVLIFHDRGDEIYDFIILFNISFKSGVNEFFLFC